MKKIARKSAFSFAVLLPVLLLSVQSTLLAAAETEVVKPESSNTAATKTAADKPSCKQCIKYYGWRGDLDFGLTYVSDDSLRFGDYRGLEKEGFYAALDGDVHFRNEQGRYFDMYAHNLGLDSRRLSLRGGNQGHYQLRFAWSEIPKYRGYGTQTPFLGKGSDSLTLPADWVRARDTSGMSALDSSLTTARLKTQRKTLDAGFTVKFAGNWSYLVDYQRQKKNGTRSFGMGMFLNNTSILPAPVNFTTNQFDMGLSWTGKRGQVRFGFIGSYFDNGYHSLSSQNPFTSSTDTQFLRAALEPENDYHQFNLTGAYAITPRVRLSGRAAFGKLRQDDAFIPYSSNPAYSGIPLPRTSLNGKLDASTYNFSGKLHARLNRRLSFTARGKWDERDNKTPVDVYTPIITEVVRIGERYNRPYSYKRQKYSADLRYRAHRIVRLGGGARQENLDRSLQEVERTKETTWWGELKLTPLVSSQLRFKYESSDRSISDYKPLDDGSPLENPLMRIFNMADRNRDRLLIELDFMPVDGLGLNFSYVRAKADYDKSPVGLQESEDKSYSFNLSYVVAKKINLYAFLTRDDIDADMLNTSGGITDLWSAMTHDKITTVGFGLSADINEKSSIGFDFVSADSTGRISVQTSANEDPFDPLKTDLKNARIHFDREINDHWGYKLYAEYEKYSSRDWAIDGLGVDGLDNVLTMGQQSPKYNVWYFRVQASYRF